MANQPLAIITYYDPTLSSKALWNAWAERIIEYLLILSAITLCLLILYKKLVQPVKHIANQAAAIAQGTVVSIVNTGINEIDILAEQLRKVQSYTVELKETHNRLKTAQAIFERSDAARESFLSMLKHTLCNHINGITGAAEMLLSGKMGEIPTPAFAKYLEDIRAAAEHMEQWTTHILYKEDVDIYVLIEQCIAIQEKAALIKEVQFQLDIEPDILPIQADPLRLKQIIVGLLHTSLYSCVGEEVIRIKVCIEKEGHKQLKITIWDNGIGISPRKMQEIGERLDNLRQVASRKSDGTDLDLGTIQKLIALHGGSFSTSSDLGKGTVFILTIPYPSIEEHTLFMGK